MGENRHYQLSLSKISVITEQDAYVALQLTSGQLLIISTEKLTLRVIPHSKGDFQPHVSFSGFIGLKRLKSTFIGFKENNHKEVKVIISVALPQTNRFPFKDKVFH